MDKKIIFAIALAVSVSMLFASCTKKDTEANDAAVTQEIQEDAVSQQIEETQDEVLNQDKDTAATDNANGQTSQSEKSQEPDNKEVKSSGALITTDDGQVVTSKDFVDLVDTFNNTDDEAAKEEARKQLEAIFNKAKENAK